MINSSKHHLTEVGESYFEHQSVALCYAGHCLKAAAMAFMHAIVPGWFQSSASDLVKKLANNRKHQSDS